MRDARPVLLTLLASLAGLVLLLLWWVSQPAPRRWTLLQAMADREDSPTLPPTHLEGQARWLLTHRLARLQGMAGLVALAVLLGACEGLRHREADVWRGMRLTSWTCGLVGLALLPGMAGGLVLCPWPWPLVGVASGSAVWSGGMMFLLSSGRPHVP